MKNKIETADTVVEILLDRSGSMSSCRENTVEGINAYISQLKEKNEGSTFVGLTLFDSSWGGGGAKTKMERVFFKPVGDLKYLTIEDFQPRGGTPLYDATGIMIESISKELDGISNNPNILVAIMTDGGNTDSQGFSSNDVKSLVQDREDDGWTFVYLGANQDAWAVSSMFGIKAGNVQNYSTSNMEGTMRGLASSTVAYTSASALSKSADPDAKYTTDSFFGSDD